MDKPVFPPSANGERPVSAIALVGFMGAGKTTVGQALALKLGWRFDDLDQLIEARRGCTVQEIFRQEGEKIFRDLEFSLLSETIGTACSDRLVLALGGGAFAVDKIRGMLQRAGVATVCLDAAVEELYQRCDQPGIVRPLRTSFEDFRRLYDNRRPSYEQANVRISTGGKQVDAIVAEIIAELKLMPSRGVSE